MFHKFNETLEVNTKLSHVLISDTEFVVCTIPPFIFGEHLQASPGCSGGGGISLPLGAVKYPGLHHYNPLASSLIKIKTFIN